MAVNTAFHTSNLHSLATERSLYQNLVKEAIQIYGHDVYYVNRTTVALDNVLGEDSLSKFTTQHPIEMYVENAEGFGGDKEIINQFGLENRNEITFVVSKERFQEMDSQITLEDGTDTTGGSILLETGTTDQSSNSSTLTTVSGDNFYILMDIATTDADRPLEGDLVYHPVIAKMFEISFVDHDEPFYQLDNNPVYKLRCKQYEYSGEIIDTGISTIDAIESDLSEVTSEYQFTLEQSTTYNENIQLEFSTQDSTDLLLEETDGDKIIGEDDTTSAGESILLENAADTGNPQYLINEDYIIGDGDTDKTTQNELFDVLDDTVLDFSETNPFGDAGSL
tara:strand:+ start:113 stop:1123 length:1011 start_codon:yes stop_codon:yes gene_type:complete